MKRNGTTPASEFLVCTPKILPRDRWADAADRALDENPAKSCNTGESLDFDPALFSYQSLHRNYDFEILECKRSESDRRISRQSVGPLYANVFSST